MIDREGYEFYLRQRISLENKIHELGDFKGKSEVSSQLMFIDERLVAKLKQAYRHSMQEMDALRFIIMEAGTPIPKT